MAFTQLQISARIQDAWGTETSCLIYGQMGDTEELTSVEALAQSVLVALDGCTDGKIVAAHILLPIVPTGVKGAPTSRSRVEQTGLLNFTASGTSKRWALAIPSVKDDIMNADRIILLVGEPANVLTTYLLNPAGNLGFNGCNETCQPLTALVDASVSFRKKRRQLGRSSLESA